MSSLAIRDAENGTIADEAKEEIVYLLGKMSLDWWRPLIYVIPFVAVQERVEKVPIEKRASIDPEYILADLRRPEFGIFEPY